MIPEKAALPLKQYTCASTNRFTALTLAFIVAGRWMVAPHHLFSFDSANFALALENFDPALHQPQPPGYPLFVALTRVIQMAVRRPENILLVAGLLAAAAATILILALGAEMFGLRAGILSAALLASNPVFWFGGDTNQIRVFLALGCLGVALPAWRALNAPETPRWLYASFAALGVCAGFRPDVAALLVPLVLWVWWRTGRRIRRLAVGSLLLAATSLPWLAYTVRLMGGWQHTGEILWSYSVDQFHGSSAAFGSSAPAAWQMLRWAIAWNLLGTLVWIWALPLIPWRPFGEALRKRTAFLAAAFFPPFLFSAFIHIGDPDQALGSVPLLCVAGGAVLAAFLRQKRSSQTFHVAAGLMAVQTLFFFVPPYHLARAASYRTITAVDRMTTNALNAIAELRGNGPITIVHYGSPVPSRQISYYFPNDYVNVLPGGPRNPQPGLNPMVFYHHHDLTVAAARSGLMSPGARRIVCLLPANSPPPGSAAWRPYGSVYYLDVTPPELPALAGIAFIPDRR